MKTSAFKSISSLVIFFIVLINNADGQSEKSIEFYNSGKEAFKKNKFKSADSLFTLSIGLNAQANTYFDRALCRQKLKDKKGACSDFWSAFNLGHSEAKVYFNEDCAVMDTLFKDARLVKTDTNSYVYKEITETCQSIKSFDYARYNKKGELLLSYYGIDKDTIYRPGREITLATFPGGSSEYKKYLNEKLVYPNSAIEKKLKGKVWISFIVAKDGRIEKVIVFKPMRDCEDCNKEALRLISEMPTWTPATRNNKAIKNNLRVAVDFKLK